MEIHPYISTYFPDVITLPTFFKLAAFSVQNFYFFVINYYFILILFSDIAAIPGCFAHGNIISSSLCLFLDKYFMIQ